MDTTGGLREKVMKKKTKGIREKAKKKETKGKLYLPDDIIPNILSRLPAKNVMQCRLVYRGWRDLTLDRDFVDLHFRVHSNIPMILVANPRWYGPKHKLYLPRRRWDHLLLDKWCEPAQSKLIIHTFPFEPHNSEFDLNILDYQAQFSHGGLTVFQECEVGEVIIVNPIYLDKVRIIMPLDFRQSQVYGVFFHPLLEEYCCLWGMKEVPWGIRRRVYPPYEPPKPIVYRILNLGSDPVMKTICNPFPQRFKRRNSHPLFINKYLYWMLEGEEEGYQYSGRSDIMRFDIISEEFNVKPCPVPVESKCYSQHTHLLNIEGALSFLVFFPSKITIWRLKDDSEELWTSSNYTFSLENFECIPYPIAVVDGNLAVLSRRRLLVCNLMQGTMSYFRKKYHGGVWFLSHQMSLASLKSCQSTIILDRNGDAYLRENGPNLVVEDIDGNDDALVWENSPNIVNIEIIDNQVEGSGPSDTHDSMSFFGNSSIDEQEDEKSETSWNSDTSDSLAGSPNSNSLVNEGSDSQLESSGPSIPRGEESTSFEIASTEEEEEEDRS